VGIQAISIVSIGPLADSRTFNLFSLCSLAPIRMKCRDGQD
jgi:hypothetical protein